MTTPLQHNVPDQQHTLTLIATVYNDSAYLSEFFASVAQQTFTDFTLVLVDDGSTDESATLARQLGAPLGNRFVLLESPTNEGLSAARNRGLDWMEQHPSTYLGFLDVDDWFEPSYLQNLVAAIRTYHADICIGGIVRYDDATGAILATEMVNGPAGVVADSSTCDLLAYINPCAYAKLFRYEPIKGLRFRQIKRSEDTCYLFEALPELPRLAFTNKAQYHYRVRPASLTANFGQAEHKSMHETFEALLPEFTQGNHRAYRELFEAQIFIHSSVGGVLRRVEQGESASGVARAELDWLDRIMPTWRTNHYISGSRATSNLQRAVHACSWLYRHNAFAVFPVIYSAFRRILRREFRA